jgi:hypothetical protein
MKRLNLGLMLVTTLLSVMTPANASTNTTRIVTLRISPSLNISGGVRVSVGIASATAGCANPTWYAYEYSNSAPGPGPVWTALLMAAQARQKAVTIVGTGSCDPQAIETIYYIDGPE